MRIIAGRFRGTQLKAPGAAGGGAAHLRPSSDRTREAVFNLLAHGGEPLPSGAMPPEGARVLDLFAGTGALGLEALSRGAARVCFVDDHAPSTMTVFSAGTTRSDWGGYHADSLSNHPGDVTTYPSLMAFSSSGMTAPSVGAYHAYRHGARQNFATGASLLYRQSNIDPTYTPGDAGLPDVVIGALGLAELIKPGTGDAVLAIPYQPECVADLAPPTGELNFFDVSIFLGAFNTQNPAADLARPFGQFDFFDVSAYLSAFGAGCP